MFCNQYPFYFERQTGSLQRRGGVYRYRNCSDGRGGISPFRASRSKGAGRKWGHVEKGIQDEVDGDEKVGEKNCCMRKSLEGGMCDQDL